MLKLVSALSGFFTPPPEPVAVDIDRTFAAANRKGPPISSMDVWTAQGLVSQATLLFRLDVAKAKESLFGRRWMRTEPFRKLHRAVQNNELRLVEFGSFGVPKALEVLHQHLGLLEAAHAPLREWLKKS